MCDVISSTGQCSECYVWLLLLNAVFFPGHIPVHPYSSDLVCLAWNYEKLLSILGSHKSVVCFLAGHNHDGGYYLDSAGIHHITLEGVIETTPNSNAFGTVYVYKDKMVLRGNGRIQDRVLMFQ